MLASFMGGLRWVTAQMVLQRDGLKLSNPLDFVYYLEPLMAGSLLPLAVGIEGNACQSYCMEMRVKILSSLFLY